MRVGIVSLIVLLVGCTAAVAQEPATKAAALPFLKVDAKKRVIEVECEALHCGNPLEFFLCLTGTSEHEAVLRSKVKPSHLHAALLMIGLKPGQPVHYSEAAQRWMPPQGPPLQMQVRFQRDGKPVELPAYRLMRDVRNKREMPPLTWIFAGSRVLENGAYAADHTGYLASVVNFDFTVIDIPKLASNANETLVWETNVELMPPVGTAVTLVIAPAGAVEAPATQAGARAVGPIDQPLIEIDERGKMKVDDVTIGSVDDLIARLEKREPKAASVRVAIANSIEENETARSVINALSRSGVRFLTIPQAAPGALGRRADVTADDAIAQMRERWERAVAPHSAAMRDAARTHYDVLRALRAQQQHLIDEADKIQRLIDQLEKRYQDMTTPQPAQPTPPAH